MELHSWHRINIAIALLLLLLLCSSCEKIESIALNIARSVRDFEDQGLDLARLRLFVHILHQVALALDPSKGDLADFLRVEIFP